MRLIFFLECWVWLVVFVTDLIWCRFVGFIMLWHFLGLHTLLGNGFGNFFSGFLLCL